MTTCRTHAPRAAARGGTARSAAPGPRADSPIRAAALQRRAGNHALQRLARDGRAVGLLQRLAAVNYPAPGVAHARVTHVDLGTGTPATVPAAAVLGHRGTRHPYHHQRGHLIARQLGGDGADPSNLVGLSDGTNAPLMADMEHVVADGLRAAGPGAAALVQSVAHFGPAGYAGPPAAPYSPGMVGSLTVTVRNPRDGALLFHQTYPNGVVNNHPAAGCC